MHLPVRKQRIFVFSACFSALPVLLKVEVKKIKSILGGSVKTVRYFVFIACVTSMTGLNVLASNSSGPSGRSNDTYDFSAAAISCGCPAGGVPGWQPHSNTCKSECTSAQATWLCDGVTVRTECVFGPEGGCATSTPPTPQGAPPCELITGCGQQECKGDCKYYKIDWFTGFMSFEYRDCE